MDMSLQSIIQPIIRILRRFHTIIFVIIVLGGLIALTLLLNGILTSSSQLVEPGNTGLSTNFDQATIKKIEELRTRDDAATGLDLSGGRSNPFVE